MIRIRHMTTADIPFGMGLKDAEGWNQLASDWQRFLALEPEGCFVAECAGEPAGTTTTCVFGSVAWIAMVLVKKEMRGRGVGRALIEHALAFLEGRGVSTVRLDATPYGQPLYAKMGFQTQFTLLRYEGTPHLQGTEFPSLAAKPWEHAELLAYDREVTRTDRRKLIEQWFADRSVDLFVLSDREPSAKGYIATRPGSRAWHIGPCIASPAAGPRLLTAAVGWRKRERVIVDTPLANEAAQQIVETHGLQKQRELVRMCRGAPVSERLDELWASSGPEMG
jgi:GNAT superfamily N-acetyltransferase